jgi:thioredoxin-like negative regulator of GroEL
MAILEVTEEMLHEKVSSALSTTLEGLLIYTPLCGTCQLAERMLEIVQATGIAMPLRKLNINYAPALREAWKITSVPCLVLLRDGTPIHMEYTMNSVDHLYNLIRSYTSAALD